MVVRDLLTRLGFQVDQGPLNKYEKSTERVKQNANDAAASFRNMFAAFAGIAAIRSIAGIADSVGGLADAIGDTLGGNIAGISSVISDVAVAVGSVAGLLGSFGIGGTTSGGQTRVPTKSNINITLVPIYSRAAARKFSLDRFVTGGYLNSSFGYV